MALPSALFPLDVNREINSNIAPQPNISSVPMSGLGMKDHELPRVPLFRRCEDDLFDFWSMSSILLVLFREGARLNMFERKRKVQQVRYYGVISWRQWQWLMAMVNEWW